MRPWYAINAMNLLETRRHGMQPEGPVMVEMGQGTHEGTALYVKPDMPAERMDWRMLVNLQVWLWADPSVPLDRLLRAVRDIAASRPAHLLLRFAEPAGTHDIEVGSGTHRPAVLGLPAEHSFTWCPINLTGSTVGSGLRRALVRAGSNWRTL